MAKSDQTVGETGEVVVLRCALSLAGDLSTKKNFPKLLLLFLFLPYVFHHS